MFDRLDDPAPPTLSVEQRQWIRTRRRSIRRRRMAARAAAAAAAVVVVGVLVVVSGERSPARTTTVAAIDHPSGRGLSAQGATCPAVVFVYLEPGLATADRDAVGAALRTDPKVTTLSYVNEAAAVAEFDVMFADQPSMLAGVKPGDLPTSYRFVSKTPVDEHALRSRYGAMKGVKNVIFQADITVRDTTVYVDTTDLIRKRGVPGAPCR